MKNKVGRPKKSDKADVKVVSYLTQKEKDMLDNLMEETEIRTISEYIRKNILK